MKRTMFALIVGALALGLVAGATAAPIGQGSSAQVAAGKHCRKHCREFEGRVLAVKSANRTFRMRDHHVGRVRIKVTRRTRFDHGINRFDQLRRGLHVEVEVSGRTASRAWKVIEIDVDRHGHGNGHD